MLQALCLFLVAWTAAAAATDAALPCILDALTRDGFQGKYSISSDEEEFQNVTDVDNGRCSVDPLIILWPMSGHDVSIGLGVSKACGSRLSVISGGHSAACFSLSENGITISLSAMSRIEPDFSTGEIRVQAGAIFKDVYTSVFNMTAGADNTRWTPVGGGCPYVGVGGFFLGGGWSFLSRSYGLATDMLLSVTTVLADGSVVVADRSDACQGVPKCRELWWASRGGGGGNFGIVIEYHFQMRISPEEILVGQLCWDQDTSIMADVWGWLLDVYPALPDWMQIDSGWLPLGENGSRLLCHTVICNHGSEDECMAIVQPLIDLGGVVLNDLKMQPYLSWQIQHDSITSAQHGQLYLTNVMMDEGVCTTDCILRIQEAVLAAPSSRNLVITHMGGGALSRISAEETAFPHRKSQFVLQVKAIWDDEEGVDGASGAAVNIAWVDQLKSWLTPMATGSYVNYMDPYLHNYLEKYYVNNLPRLRQAKYLLDPDYVFKFNQSVTY